MAGTVAARIKTPLAFVSYRRIDSAATAGRRCDRLVNEFGKTRVFMDVEGSIPNGADFPAEIERALAASSALVVVIGRQWLTCTDAQGNPRISNEDDWVANEVAAALDRGILALPVLVNGASMPQEGALPKRIAALSRKQASDIRASSWDYDVSRIVATLTPVLRTGSRRTRGAVALAGAATAIGIAVLVTTWTPARNTIDGSSTTPIESDERSPVTKPESLVPEPPVPASLVPPGLYNLDFSSFPAVDVSDVQPRSGTWIFEYSRLSLPAPNHLTASRVAVLTKRPAIREPHGHRRSATLKGHRSSLSSTEPKASSN